jgi:hypothetical protein
MNRDHYGVTYSRYWEGTTGRAIQEKGKDPTILSLYLMSCRHANMIGLYELPLVHLERELLVVKGRIPILRAFSDLHVLQYATYDMGTEHVWVREMARIRVGLGLNETITTDDRKHRAILKQYATARPNPFLGPFYERYATQLQLRDGRIGPPLIPVSKGLADAIARSKKQQLKASACDADLWKCGRNVEKSDHGLSPFHAPCKPSEQVQQQVQVQGSGSGTGTGTGKAAAAPRHTPPDDDDAEKNGDVITSLILKEIFPLVGVSVQWTDLKEILIARCRALDISYTYDVFRRAHESALLRAELKRAGGRRT